jgi:hypothetical protein
MGRGNVANTQLLTKITTNIRPFVLESRTAIMYAPQKLANTIVLLVYSSTHMYGITPETGHAAA